MLSGVGGQIDFMRGAALGLDGLGKPILAMTSATKRGESKIVPVLKEGQTLTTVQQSISKPWSFYRAIDFSS